MVALLCLALGLTLGFFSGAIAILAACKKEADGGTLALGSTVYYTRKITPEGK